jgi:hypothetical protein
MTYGYASWLSIRSHYAATQSSNKYDHSNYVPIREASIDHIDPSQKLDNRRKNLRIASRTVVVESKEKR